LGQTVTRRISRAKRTIKESGVPFALPGRDELPGRLAAVMRVLYLIFNEGYASTGGPDLVRVEMADEAIRLTRALHALVADDAEVSGLLALMLLVHARHRARAGSDGSLIALGEQDRILWDRDLITDGSALVAAALAIGSTGPYQLQAAIAAVHDQADSIDTTDWHEIVALYGLLLQLQDNPVVALNHAVAISMVDEPEAGLELLARLEKDSRINTDRRFHGVRGHLLERTGDPDAALAAYTEACRRAPNVAQQRYLSRQISRLQTRT
jgi:predicted RNA polymerase sigma factor